jgi:hypothetical protein
VIHTLVTDDQAPRPFVDELEAAGIRVILA